MSQIIATSTRLAAERLKGSTTQKPKCTNCIHCTWITPVQMSEFTPFLPESRVYMVIVPDRRRPAALMWKAITTMRRDHIPKIKDKVLCMLDGSTCTEPCTKYKTLLPWPIDYPIATASTVGRMRKVIIKDSEGALISMPLLARAPAWTSPVHNHRKSFRGMQRKRMDTILEAQYDHYYRLLSTAWESRKEQAYRENK